MTRDEALSILKTFRISGDKAHEAFDMAIKALEQTERKTGEWIGEQPWCLPKCSICGASSFGQHGFDAIKTPYCPNCGAKMKLIGEGGGE